jgi:hypothetical protein
MSLQKVKSNTPVIFALVSKFERVREYLSIYLVGQFFAIPRKIIDGILVPVPSHNYVETEATEVILKQENSILKT